MWRILTLDRPTATVSNQTWMFLKNCARWILIYNTRHIRNCFGILNNTPAPNRAVRDCTMAESLRALVQVAVVAVCVALAVGRDSHVQVQRMTYPLLIHSKNTILVRGFKHLSHQITYYPVLVTSTTRSENSDSEWLVLLSCQWQF